MFELLTSVSQVYLLLFCLISAYLLTVTILNHLYKRKIPPHPAIESGPMVSVLIPARNEEETIGVCLDSLLNQTYGNYEIIVLDDGSGDSTWEILTRYSKLRPSRETSEQLRPRIRILQGEEKPDNWKGKTFAVKQLADAAEGKYLYMTDADTIHDQEALAWALNLRNNEFPAHTAVLYPVFVLMFIFQAVLAVHRNIKGNRPSWKSRTVS